MTFVQAIQAGFKNYVQFSGRASRAEYWWFFLFYLIVIIVPDTMMQGEVARGQPGIFSALTSLVGLIFLLPNLGLAFRRLHDTDRSAWWLLIALSGIGVFVLLFFFAQPGTAGPNKFGPDPKGGNAATF